MVKGSPILSSARFKKLPWIVIGIFAGIFIVWTIRTRNLNYLLILGAFICVGFVLKWIIEKGVANVHDDLKDTIKDATREALDETHLKETIRDAVQEALENNK
jgi:hypothetical protein